jgi:hypothetical protein
MKIQLVDNGPRQEQPFVAISAENFEERDQLEGLLFYKEAVLLEASPGFKVGLYLTRKNSIHSQAATALK